jgi:hypothetical protein
LQSTDSIDSKPTTNIGQLAFSWSGTNAASYSNLDFKYVASVAAESYPAALTTLTAAPSKGKVTITFVCNSSSIFYFALSLSNSSLSNL